MTVPATLGVVSNDLRAVERELLAVPPGDFPELGAVISELIRSGGKRIRPALVLLAARFNHYHLPTLVDGAVAAELLHTATLVHDDTIDESHLRRGRPTANSYLPASLTILIGDYIFAQSALYAARPGNPAVVAVFAQTLRRIVDGELRQALGNHRATLGRDEYFRRIDAKTAALFACSAEIGALLSGASEGQRLALRRYAQKLGQAYQITDDVLDFDSTTARSGKPVGSDLLHGTATLPSIIFLETLATTEAERDAVLAVLEGREGSDPETATELIRSSGALALVREEARLLADEACAALLSLPTGEPRSALQDLARDVIQRDR